MALAWFTRPRLLALAALLQAACGLLLLLDIASEASSFRSNPLHGALDASILVALIAGSLILLREFDALRAHNRRMESGLQVASGGFADLLDETFADWRLTPAERHVALLVIKGFSIAEIAALRSSREGTVRAQCAAVYRKAGVSGQAQLLGHFIDELMAGVELPVPGSPDRS